MIYPVRNRRLFDTGCRTHGCAFDVLLLRSFCVVIVQHSCVCRFMTQPEAEGADGQENSHVFLISVMLHFVFFGYTPEDAFPLFPRSWLCKEDIHSQLLQILAPHHLHARHG